MPMKKSHEPCPLDQIEFEHTQQLQLLAIFDRITTSDDSRDMARSAPEVLTFLTQDLARHMEYEESALFPILKQRCRLSDDIELILNQLSYEHGLDRDLVDFLVTDLERISHGHHGSIPARFHINARAFIETQRRHIQWENRIVLPLARKRLTYSDLADLSKRMT